MAGQPRKLQATRISFMRLVLFLLTLPLLQAQSTDPAQLLQQAKQLLQQPGRANEALPLLQAANSQWQSASSNDPAYAESLDLYAVLSKNTRPAADLEPLAAHAVAIYDANPGTASDVLALALEIDADLLGRTVVGAPAWARATGIRARRVADLPFHTAAPVEAPLRISRENGVSTPVLISKREPQYTEAARLSKVSGSVLVSIVIDKDGIPRDVQLKRGCGYGLDEKAAEIVSLWRFKPGLHNGEPVAVQAQIEVNFRLLDTPPAGVPGDPQKLELINR